MEGNQVGSSPPTNNSNTTSTYYSSSLGQRLIGVGIVLGLLVVALLLWVRFAKWPRRKLRGLGCTCLPEPRRSKATLAEEGGMGPGGFEISQRNVRGSSRVTIQIPPEYARSPEHHASFRDAEVGLKHASSSRYKTHWEEPHPDVIPPPKLSSGYYK